jgi:transglutaminase-like putative cysteine protease
MNYIDQRYLSATEIMDSDHQTIIAYAKDTISGVGSDPAAQAVELYYAVRDRIWYDPYTPFYLPEHYRASNVLKNGRGYCVSKASLLCALARVCNIPARVGFADVRNHLATRQLIEYIGCDLFVYHGFTEFYLDGKWVRATPAFNIELCRRHNVLPLDFNGREDSIFHAYNTEKEKFMEYVAYHGTYADIPVETIVAAWKLAYGKDRVNAWIKRFEALGGKSGRNFDGEEIVKD